MKFKHIGQEAIVLQSKIFFFLNSNVKLHDDCIKKKVFRLQNYACHMI